MLHIVSPIPVSTATSNTSTIEQTGQPGCTPMIKLDQRWPYICTGLYNCTRKKKSLTTSQSWVLVSYCVTMKQMTPSVHDTKVTLAINLQTCLPQNTLSVLRTAYVRIFRFSTGFSADAPPISHLVRAVCELASSIIQTHNTFGVGRLYFVYIDLRKSFSISASLATNSQSFTSRFPYFLDTLCPYFEKYRRTSVLPADFRTNTVKYGRVGRSEPV